MSIHLEYVADRPSAEIMYAIAEDVGHWRESLMPAPLREKGMYRVSVDVNPPNFRIYCPSNRRPSTWYDVRGKVTVEPDGSTRIRVRAGVDRSRFSGPILFAILASVAWHSNVGAALGLAAIAGATGVLYYGYDNGLASGADLATDHMLGRLDAVMQTLSARLTVGTLVSPSAKPPERGSVEDVSTRSGFPPINWP